MSFPAHPTHGFGRGHSGPQGSQASNRSGQHPLVPPIAPPATQSSQQQSSNAPRSPTSFGSSSRSSQPPAPPVGNRLTKAPPLGGSSGSSYRMKRPKLHKNSTHIQMYLATAGFATAGVIWFLLAFVNVPRLALTVLDEGEGGRIEYVHLTGFCSSTLAKDDSDLGGKVPCESGSDLAAAQGDNAIRVALESFAWLWILNVMLGTFHSFAACLCFGLSLKKYEIDLQEHRGRRLRKMIASTNIGMIITTAVLNSSVVRQQRHESNGNFGGGFWAILVAIALGLPSCFILLHIEWSGQRWDKHRLGRLQRSNERMKSSGEQQAQHDAIKRSNKAEREKLLQAREERKRRDALGE